MHTNDLEFGIIMFIDAIYNIFNLADIKISLFKT